MKLLAIFCCILLASFANEVVGQETRVNSGWAQGTPITTSRTPAEVESTTIYYPPQKPQRPCEPNGLDDYKGGCDDSVPVIVMPKGRPIMERVLDWLKSCVSE